MDNNGFSLMDVRRTFWKMKDYFNYRGKGSLVFGDALYFKKIDIFYQQISAVNDTSYIKSKIYKSILICVVYRMFDYAVALAKSSYSKGYLSNNECEKIISRINRCAISLYFPRFHLNKGLYKILKLILEKVKPPSFWGWVDSDDEIGNIKDR